MLEIGAAFAIVNPDGSRAVFNDPTDPDHVGFLTGGMEGLAAPEVRLGVGDLPGQDGGWMSGPGYYSVRPVVFEGILAVGTAGTANAAEERLRRAVSALRDDMTISWWPAGLPELQITARLQQPLRVQPGRPRRFQFGVVSADHRIYSTEEVTRIRTYAEDPSLTVAAGNQGTCPAPFACRITGPITNPEVILVGTDRRVSLTAGGGLTLASGEYVDLDFKERTAVKNGTTNVYDRVAFATADWFHLPPQSFNDVRMDGTGRAAQTELRLTYRHAWV